MKFTPGFRSLLHSHTFDYYAMWFKGVISNPEKGEKDSPLPVGVLGICAVPVIAVRIRVR